MYGVWTWSISVGILYVYTDRCGNLTGPTVQQMMLYAAS